MIVVLEKHYKWLQRQQLKTLLAETVQTITEEFLTV